MKSIIEQKPATKNQITNNKPDIIKNSNVLQSTIVNSMNGGHIKPIGLVPIMAGTRLMELRLRANIKMLTPKTPAWEKLKMSIKTFYVPNSRVWKNWEQFEALKGGATVSKISEIPNLGGKELPIVEGFNEDYPVERAITDTTTWRDSWVSSYIPRYQTGMVETGNPYTNTFPKYSILPLRGFKAIYNDMLRNKEYDSQMEEFFDDTMSSQEYDDIFTDMLDSRKIWKFNLRGRRQNSYYTDYRTELLGNELEYSLEETPNMLSTLTEWQKQLAFSRQQSENSQLNDWDIIAKAHGSKKLSEGKVQLLNEQAVGLNYQSVTQSAYNINEKIQKEFQVLGEQGAYCYTEIDIPLTQMIEFKETGYIHIIVQITADTVFESAFDRTLLNVGAYDIYRPELCELKDDVLYDIEKCGTRIEYESDLTKITGYKRKFSEYFKLPNVINGDLMTNGFVETTALDNKILINQDMDGKITTLLSKKSFQFFEIDDKQGQDAQGKNIWQDYTDIAINDNQAIKNTELYLYNYESENEQPQWWITGDNQAFLIGQITAVEDMPIEENIRNNYTTWGEL